MTLAQEIEILNREMANNLPEEVTEAFQNAIQDWIAAGIDKTALNVGDKIPSIQLFDATGESVIVDDLLKYGPVVISFYRGGWCPWCNLELRTLQKYLANINKYNGQLLAISAELPDRILNTVEKDSLEFPVLTDPDLGLARQFGLVFQLPPKIEDITKNVFDLDLKQINGMDSYELPIPATYVVDMKHIIRYAFVDANFMNRAEPESIIEILKNLS